MAPTDESTSRKTTPPAERVESVGRILALGYMRYRRNLAGSRLQKDAPTAKKPLDDVTPRGTVGTGEDRTPETEGDA